MRQLIAFACATLGFLLATPATAQPCEALGTCPRPAPRPPVRPAPRPPAQPAAPRVDPCVALWRTANTGNTASALENFARRCPRHSEATTARRRIATLRCDSEWARVDSAGLLDDYLSFERACSNHREIASARARVDAIRAAPWVGASSIPFNSPILRSGVSAQGQSAAVACESGNWAECNRLGSMFHTGSGAPRSGLWSNALYARACAGGEPFACANLGAAFHTGRGVPRDYARAANLYERGCNGGSGFGCTYLAGMFHGGLGVDEDHVTELRFYERGCNGGNPGGFALGCQNAALTYERGTQAAARNLTRALQLSEMGLRLDPSNTELAAMRDRLRR